MTDENPTFLLYQHHCTHHICLFGYQHKGYTKSIFFYSGLFSYVITRSHCNDCPVKKACTGRTLKLFPAMINPGIFGRDTHMTLYALSIVFIRYKHMINPEILCAPLCDAF